MTKLVYRGFQSDDNTRKHAAHKQTAKAGLVYRGQKADNAAAPVATNRHADLTYRGYHVS